jgi:hypothetical protein
MERQFTVPPKNKKSAEEEKDEKHAGTCNYFARGNFNTSGKQSGIRIDLRPRLPACAGKAV